jgi:AcrR family transcriptional regulator
MSPRTYRLGKRAEAVAQTRGRIVQAAMALYQEEGIANTTMQEVARRADVAPGTVLNHFPTPDDLTQAVIDQLMADLHLPSEDILDGLPSIRERVARLARELAAFYQRSEPWYQVHRREVGRSKVFAEAESRFFQLVDRLMRHALSDLAGDYRALAVLRTFMNPPVFGGLQAMGIPADEAADLVSDLLVPWLERRAANPERVSISKA